MSNIVEMDEFTDDLLPALLQTVAARIQTRETVGCYVLAVTFHDDIEYGHWVARLFVQLPMHTGR